MDEKLNIAQKLFILFVASQPFANVLGFTFLNEALQVSDVLLLGTGAIWVISLRSDRGYLKHLKWNWFYVVLAAYAVAVTLSAVFSIDPARSSVKLLGKFYLIGIAFLTFNIITSFGVLNRVLQGWLVGAAAAIVCCLAGIGLFYAGFTDTDINLVVHPTFGSLPSGNYPRIEGFFFYPSVLSNFLGVTWILGLLIYSTGRVKRSVFWMFGSALILVNAFTLTPGLGGIFLTTGLYIREKLKGQTRWRFFSVAAPATGALIAVLFLFAATVTLFSYNSGRGGLPLLNGQVSLSHRAHAWGTAFGTFLEHPILGRGVDMPVAHSEFIDPSGNRQLLTDAHNIYLCVLAETGLLGLLTLSGIAIMITVGLVRRQRGGTISGTVKFCLLLALLDGLYYQGLTGSYEDTRHLWVLVGIAAAVGRADFDADENALAPQSTPVTAG